MTDMTMVTDNGSDRPIVLISEENDELLRLYHSAILEAGLSHGEVWVANLEGEQETGAIAIWWPPGSKFDDESFCVAHGSQGSGLIASSP